MNTTAALAFFSGKARTNAEASLATLEAAVAAGEWQSRTSRTVRATLSKTNITAKWISRFETKYGRITFKSLVVNAAHALRFGVHDDKPMAVEGLDPLDLDVALYLNDFVAAFAEINAAMDLLDMTVPKPVITVRDDNGLSATQAATLTSLKVSSLGVVPMRFEQVKIGDKLVQVAHLLWPAGTRHGVTGRDGHQCEACGHAIRVRNNWVPLVATTDAGHASLWVGRDCAKRLFGFHITGDLIINDADAHA